MENRPPNTNISGIPSESPPAFLIFRRHMTQFHVMPLWRVLEKFGVPPVLLAVIRSFHEDMRGLLYLLREDVQTVLVRNGVQQGCTITPVLYIVDDRRKQCPQTFYYCHRHKLIGDRAPKSWLRSCVIESKLVMMSLYVTSCEEALSLPLHLLLWQRCGV